MNENRRHLKLNLLEIVIDKIESSDKSTGNDLNFNTWQLVMASFHPFLADEVVRLGLSTNGKSELDLAREVIFYRENNISCCFTQMSKRKSWLM